VGGAERRVGAEAQLRSGSEDLLRWSLGISGIGDGRNARTGVYFWKKGNEAQKETWV
jgi:hypothetical protein